MTESAVLKVPVNQSKSSYIFISVCVLFCLVFLVFCLPIMNLRFGWFLTGLQHCNHVLNYDNFSKCFDGLCACAGINLCKFKLHALND